MGVIRLTNSQIYAKDTLQTPNNGWVILWIKLDKKFFNTENDTFVGGICIPPVNSNYLKFNNIDMFSILDKDIALFNSSGNVITCGDINSRIGSLQDGIIESARDNNFITLPKDYQIDYLPKRHSLDTNTNRYKKPFLDFLLRSNLRIINGRILGDLSGSFTCYEWNGHSQIDYFLTTPDIFPLFIYLKVEQKSEYSDHCLISCGINRFRLLQTPASSNYLSLPTKYIWNRNPDHIKKVMKLDSAQSLLNEVFTKPLEQMNRENIDNATQDVTSIINKVMDTCLQIKRKQRNRKPRFYNKKFFDQECKETKLLMRKYNSLMSKNPFNREFNTLYFQYLKKYKKTLRKKKHDYENKSVSQLESLADRDPKKYRKFVDTLKQSVKRNASSTISDSEWNDHFRNLFNRKHESSSHYVNRISTKIKILAEIKCFNELDYAITNKEILHYY